MLLIPRFAAMGAAWATTLSFLLMAMVTYVLSQRVYRIPYSLFKIALPLVLATGTYLLATLIDVPSLIVTIAMKVVLIAGFGFVVLASGFFEESETRQLRKALQGVWERLGWGVANALER
jgi:O-antigen/teichoic acid export membrane protein